MRFATPKVLRRAGVGLACLGLLVTGVATSAGSSFADSPHSAANTPQWANGPDYLALGDSVSFGYREANTTPPPDYTDASSFVGYPEDVAAALGLNVANAACPGETSLSLIAANVQSNGCENSPGGGSGYRTYFPLHVQYSGTQLQYAVQYLRHHPDTKLVTLMIGANDAFLCEETTTDDCASELPGVLAQISVNVTKTLTAIRHEAHYRGPLVIVNYYSLDYSSATAEAGSQALNAAMDDAAAPFNVKIADGYGVFEAAAAHSVDNSCTAGLLTQLSPQPSAGCGVHPSFAGQSLLALAVEEALHG